MRESECNVRARVGSRRGQKETSSEKRAVSDRGSVPERSERSNEEGFLNSVRRHECRTNTPVLTVWVEIHCTAIEIQMVNMSPSYKVELLFWLHSCKFSPKFATENAIRMTEGTETLLACEKQKFFCPARHPIFLALKRFVWLRFCLSVLLWWSE